MDFPGSGVFDLYVSCWLRRCVCDDQYFHGVFLSFISEQHLEISSLELLTIVVALKLWGARWTGLRITVLCHNEAAEPGLMQDGVVILS